jgi:hypothetical protein
MISNLVFLEPFLQQLFSTLLKDRPCQFKGFEVVEFAFFEKDAEILKNGGETTRKCGCLLERLYNGYCP